MAMSAEDRFAEQWLIEIHDRLPEQGAAQILIPDATGVRDVWLSRQDIIRYQAIRATRARRQYQLSLTVMVALLMVIMVVFGYTHQLNDDKERLVTQLDNSDVQLRLLTQGVEELVQVAEKAGDTSLGQPSSNIVDRLSDVAEYIETKDEAFAVYAEFTRELVHQHLATLDEEFGEAGIELTEALESVSLSNQSRIGGQIEADDQLSSMINQYVALDATEGLARIAQAGVFRASLPRLDPVIEPRLTSGFGMRKHPVTGRMMPHRGIDLVSYESRDVLSSGPGQVTFAGYQGLYGNLVVIDHGANIETRYAHLSEIHVDVGERVQGGAKLGYMGSTGRTTGKHLHFEVSFGDRQIDPVTAQRVARNVQ